MLGFALSQHLVHNNVQDIEEAQHQLVTSMPSLSADKQNRTRNPSLICRLYPAQTPFVYDPASIFQLSHRHLRRRSGS